MQVLIFQIKGLAMNILFADRYFGWIAALLLCAETALNLLIIRNVSYTEIDWKAYMQEVEGVRAGERNYLKLQGDTGPLVYPAGFVWIYQLLRYLTNGGTDIRRAQYIFMGIYLTTLSVVLLIYRRARMPVIWLVLLVMSKRLHSIYVLRLFNDGVAMLFAYVAIYMLTTSWGRWSGCVLSLGISVKMNVALMVPGFLYVWWRQEGVGGVLRQMLAVAGWQLVVGWPFIQSHPREYLQRAFDFGRQFEFRWTVNWRFVGAQMFGSWQWATGLLVVHVVLLLAMGLRMWPRRLAGSSFWAVVRQGLGRRTERAVVGAEEAVLAVGLANFVGIVCARSLHYQFYSWYYHTVPYLLYRSGQHWAVQVLLWAAIEYAWNVYPSTSLSSVLLLLAHLYLLASILICAQTKNSVKSKRE